MKERRASGPKRGKSAPPAAAKKKKTDKDPNGFSIQEKVWRYPGPAGWFFIRVPKSESDSIRFIEDVRKVGWGYIRIDAKIGASKWSTTLFPTKEKDYLIAIKASVRKAEHIEEGQWVEMEFTLS